MIQGTAIGRSGRGARPTPFLPLISTLMCSAVLLCLQFGLKYSGVGNDWGHGRAVAPVVLGAVERRVACGVEAAFGGGVCGAGGDAEAGRHLAAAFKRLSSDDVAKALGG